MGNSYIVSSLKNCHPTFCSPWFQMENRDSNRHLPPISNVLFLSLDASKIFFFIFSFWKFNYEVFSMNFIGFSMSVGI